MSLVAPPHLMVASGPDVQPEVDSLPYWQCPVPRSPPPRSWCFPTRVNQGPQLMGPSQNEWLRVTCERDTPILSESRQRQQLRKVSKLHRCGECCLEGALSNTVSSFWDPECEFKVGKESPIKQRHPQIMFPSRRESCTHLHPLGEGRPPALQGLFCLGSGVLGWKEILCSESF